MHMRLLATMGLLSTAILLAGCQIAPPVESRFSSPIFTDFGNVMTWQDRDRPPYVMSYPDETMFFYPIYGRPFRSGQLASVGVVALPAGERRDHVLQATALVNEAYLRLIDIRRVQWQDRAHFFAMAARLMRRVLVDFARARKNQKRGGALHRVTFDQNLLVTSDTPEDLIAIDEALRSLAAQHERKSQVVELRFFGGLSVEETAEALKISAETVMRDWKFAKNWLMRELSRTSSPGARP
jgi:RNA polymerase sigma factor (TIGR02999 family)